LIECVQELPKSYIATFLLGRQSETEDVEAPAVELVNPPVPSRDDVAATLPQFCGEILQRPPAYSALKVQGRRAYALARRGQAVELKPRPITIHQLGIVRYAYPELTLAVECGSGTYVRSLGRDIAAALGTAAVMSALERTAIGKFTIAQACPLEQLTAQTLESFLLPPIRAVDHLPSVVMNAAQVEEMAHGRTVRGTVLVDTPFAAALDERGQLLGLLRAVQAGVWQPHRNFAASS
jgi:tRNA pseudouridine55 synthase